MTTYVLAVGGTITNDGTIITSSTNPTPIPAGKTWGGLVEYAALAGSQTVVGGTYNNLLLDNTSGTNTAGGNIVVNGTMTTTAGGTLSMGTTNILSGTGTFNNLGTIKTAVPTATSSTPIPAGKTWGGTIEYNGSVAQTAVYGTYNNLTINTAEILVSMGY